MMKSETSSNYQNLDTATSVRTDTVMGYKLSFNEVKNRYIILEGTWLGNVQGSLKLKKQSFLNNVQMFLRAYEPTKVTFVLEQDSYYYDHEDRRSACIMIFKMKNNGKRVNVFNENNLFAKSIVSRRNIKLTCKLDATTSPYVIVVTHTTTKEGQYRLGIECADPEQQVSLRIPRSYSNWFKQSALEHRLSVTASFDGKTVTPENHTTGNWLKDAIQIPVICEEPTRVLVRLTRTSSNPLSMGCFLAKCDGMSTSSSYYPHSTLQSNTIVGKHERFVSTNVLEFRAFLQPKRFPYILFPVTEFAGEIGDFELEIFSDNELKNVHGARVKQRYTDSGVWYERTCGADGAIGQKKQFFRCPQYFLTIKNPDESQLHKIAVTITVEQHVKTNQHVAAGIVALKGGYRVTQQNFHEDMIVTASRPYYQATSTLQVTLYNGQAYTLIPFPRNSRFSNDIRFTITVNTFLPGEASVEFHPCPNNSEEFQNLYEFQAHSLTGRWDLLSAGGQPVISDRFFSNPQYGFELLARSSVQVSLERLTESWVPMGFFIVKTENLHQRIEDMDLIVEPSGLIGHRNQVQARDADRLVGQVRFTSGIEKSTFGNFTLTEGCYTIIAANGIIGRSGDFQLRLLCESSDIDFKKLEDVSNMSTVIKKGAFIGGLNTLKTDDENFRKVNPAYTVTVAETHNVYFDLSHGKPINKMHQPKSINLGIAIFDEENNLIKRSVTCSWHSVNCSVELKAGLKYSVYVATTLGSEGNYKLTTASNSHIDLVALNNSVCDPFETSGIQHALEPLNGNWSGLAGPGEKDSPNVYNPAYTLNIEKKTSCMIEYMTSMRSGFRIFSSGELYFDSGVINPAKILLKRNKIVRYFVLKDAGEYILEPYPELEGHRGCFSITLSSDNKDLAAIPREVAVPKVFEYNGAWNIGLVAGRIKSDPQWAFTVTKKTHLVLELEKTVPENGLDRYEDEQLAFMNKSSFTELIPTKSLQSKQNSEIAIVVASANGDRVQELNSDLVVKDSAWERGRRVVLSTTLEPSDDPYTIITTCKSSLPQRFNAFKFSVFTIEEDSVAIAPLPHPHIGPTNFGETATGTLSRIKAMWNEFSVGHPTTSEHWYKSPMVRLELADQTNVNLKISLNTFGLDTSAGFIVLQPISEDASKPDNDFSNNVVVGESIYIRENTMASCSLHLSNPKLPVFIVPYTLYQYQIKSRFDVQVHHEESTKLSLAVVEEEEPKLFHYHGIFPLHSGSSEESIKNLDVRGVHPGSFAGHPRFTLDSATKQKIDVQLKVETLKEIGVILAKVVDDAEEYVCSSSWNSSGYLRYTFNLEENFTYVLIPTVRPFTESESFSFEVQRTHDCSSVDEKALDISPSQPEVTVDFDDDLDTTLHMEGSWNFSDGTQLCRSTPGSWKNFHSISLSCKETPQILKVDITHTSDEVTMIGYYLLKHTPEISDHFFENEVFARSEFVPYLTTISTQLLLQVGKYILLPVLRSGEGESEYNISLSFNKEHVSTEIDDNHFTTVDSVAGAKSKYKLEKSSHLFSYSNLNRLVKTGSASKLDQLKHSENPKGEHGKGCLSNAPHRSCNALLKQVTKLPLGRSTIGNLDHPRYASPLTVWGQNAFPLLTGTSTSRYVYDSNELCDVRQVRKLDKLGNTSDLFVDLYLPYMAGGEHKKGRFVAIGDTRLFFRQDDDFSRDRTSSNQAFLHNCMNWVTPRSKQNIDYISTNDEDERPNSAGSTLSNLSTTGSSITPIRGEAFDLTKAHVICYSKNKDQLPLDTLAFDYEVKHITDLDSQEHFNCDILFLVFSEHESVSPATVAKIRQEVFENGSGLIMLGNCSAFHPTDTSTLFVPNQILKGTGVAFGDSDVLQNSQHNHKRSLWWLSPEQIEQYAKPNLFQMQKEYVEVRQSRHGLAHVGQCIELFLNYYHCKPPPSNAPRAEKNQFSQIFHILQHACYTIPAYDQLIMPTLLKYFGNRNLSISAETPVSYHCKDRLSLALNNHLWLTRDVQDGYVLPDRAYNNKLEVQTHTITLSGVYQKLFSLGIYAHSSELLTVTLPDALVGHCKLYIGWAGSDMFWLRDTDLTRYPLEWRMFEGNTVNVPISNCFGGLVYIEFSHTRHKRVFGSTITVEGGMKAPLFELNKTTPEEWREQVMSNPETVKDCEWVSDKIVLTLPVAEAAVIENPQEVIQYYVDAVEAVEELVDASFPYTQRITTDTQFVSGVTCEGFPICVHRDLLVPSILHPQFDNASVSRELGFNMLHKHSYVWTNREFAIANVFKAYFYERRYGIKVNQTHFYTTNIQKMKKFILSGSFTDVSATPMSPAPESRNVEDSSSRFEEYSKNYELATMLEFILLEAFGWEPYKELLSAYHNDYDVKNRRDMTNQERVDRWVQRYSEVVRHDVSGFFEKFGIKVNSGVKSRLEFYPSWIIPF